MARTDRTESGGGGPSGFGEGAAGAGARGAKPVKEGFSYRSSELPKNQVKEIKKQNQAAESMKSKDLDASERGKQAARTREYGIQQREEYAHKKGLAKGAAAGAAATAAIVAGINAAKKKGTQPDHHVTDGKNHTKPLTPAQKNFVEGQKVKEKIAKKTGVYPNTAN